MVNTTAHTAEGYTKREVQDARFARLGQGHMTCPFGVDYKHMVRYNVIKNCPVTPRQVTNATNIFGRNLQSTTGKTIRNRPRQVIADYVEVPRHLEEINKNVIFSATVMFVHGLGFLMTRSRSIKFITQQFVPTRTADILGYAINDVTRFYNSHDF